MKKKLLFFGYTLDMGGAEKVLIDYLNVLSKSYDIDLALLKVQGALLPSLPQGIKTIEIRKGFFPYLLFRYIPFFRKRKINKIANGSEYVSAVGFFEGRSATWVADIKKNVRKIAWVHTDVNHFDIGISVREATDSYSKMDAVVLVSDDAKNSFLNKYKIDSERVKVLYNLIDDKKILALSQEKVEPNDCFTFVNIGRLSPPKRQDRLVEIAKRLRDKNLVFKIQIIGDGTEREKLEKSIKNNQLEDKVKLLGLKSNPYPYIKQADCFVLTSDFEGFGIAAKEALVLGTPVISTAVTGIKEVLKGGDYGILCDVDTEALYNAMYSVLASKEILRDARKKLENFDCSNGPIINQLFSIMEGI